jgi:hypothetical protein
MPDWTRDCFTVSGLEIDCDDTARPYHGEKSYFLRWTLRVLSREAWDLMCKKKERQAVQAAIEFLREELQHLRHTTERAINERLSDESDAILRALGPPRDPDVERKVLRRNLSVGFVARVATGSGVFHAQLLGRTNCEWCWEEVYAAAALGCIDEALRHIERNDVLSAVECAFDAQGLVDDARNARYILQCLSQTISDIGRRGADLRHAANRAARARALQLYRANTYRSRMQAAREISRIVNRAEITVRDWLIEADKEARMSAHESESRTA